jgi:nucleotide-binding universal stress UspA family protein
MYERLLVPIKDNNPSKAALDEVIKLATERARLIRLVHVVDSFHWNASFPEGSIGSILMESLREPGRKILTEGKAALSQYGVACEIELLESHGAQPADMIVTHARAWSADLVLMGTHGRGRFGRAILGSNTAQIVRTASMPVLLVRAHTPQICAGLWRDHHWGLSLGAHC